MQIYHNSQIRNYIFYVKNLLINIFFGVKLHIKCLLFGLYTGLIVENLLIECKRKINCGQPAPKNTYQHVKATDLRAGAAMIIAALGARGTTRIEDIRHIERGYEDVVEKFASIGADIKRVYTDDGATRTA